MPRYGKDENGHSVAIWFEPSMNLSHKYVDWLLENISLIADGRYPPDPSPSGYTDSNIQQGGVNSKASFITASEIYSELTRRIDACFPDCYFVYKHYEKGYSFERIAKIHHKAFDKIQPRINKVLEYISSGSDPMWITLFNSDGTIKRMGVEYRDFVGHRRNVIANAIKRV